jgi:hypothetical protein
MYAMILVLLNTTTGASHVTTTPGFQDAATCSRAADDLKGAPVGLVFTVVARCEKLRD